MSEMCNNFCLTCVKHMDQSFVPFGEYYGLTPSQLMQNNSFLTKIKELRTPSVPISVGADVFSMYLVYAQWYTGSHGDRDAWRCNAHI